MKRKRNLAKSKVSMPVFVRHVPVDAMKLIRSAASDQGIVQSNSSVALWALVQFANQLKNGKVKP